MKKLLVIDTSYESMLNIDYVRAKECGVKGVILHAGYGSDISQKDKAFDEAYEKVKAAGLMVGAYWFDYFRNDEDAREEAQTFNAAISGKEFDLPLFFDYEEATIDYCAREGSPLNEFTDRLIIAMECMKELGWNNVGFYTNTSCLRGSHGAEALDVSRLAGYPFWHACFDGSSDDETDFDGLKVIGEQWGNNDMKPENISWIDNIDVSTFYIDETEMNTPSGEWTREQAVDVIDAMYNGLFGRGYTQGENEALENLLMHEWTRIQAFDDLRNSDEYNNNHPDPVKLQLIKDCYMTMRGSEPGVDEINFWMLHDEDTIKHGILYSDEFNNKYGV